MGVQNWLDAAETPESEEELKARALPLGVFAVTLDEVKFDQAGDHLIKVVNIRATIRKPSEFADQSYYGTLWMGTKADPDGDDPKTRKGRGYRLLKLLCEKTGVNTRQDPNVVLEDLQDQKVLIKNKPRTYRGETRNDIAFFYAMDETKPGVSADADADEAPARRATNGSGQRGLARPVVDDDDERPVRRTKPQPARFIPAEEE